MKQRFLIILIILSYLVNESQQLFFFAQLYSLGTTFNQLYNFSQQQNSTECLYEIGNLAYDIYNNISLDEKDWNQDQLQQIQKVALNGLEKINDTCQNQAYWLIYKMIQDHFDQNCVVHVSQNFNQIYNLYQNFKESDNYLQLAVEGRTMYSSFQTTAGICLNGQVQKISSWMKFLGIDTQKFDQFIEKYKKQLAP